MTTNPVQSISDEVLAEIESFCAMEIFEGDAASPQTMGELRGLIARLKAAEVDAARYRWLRNESLNCEYASPIFTTADEYGMNISDDLLDGDSLDKWLDAAMSRAK